MKQTVIVFALKKKTLLITEFLAKRAKLPSQLNVSIY